MTEIVSMSNIDVGASNRGVNLMIVHVLHVGNPISKLYKISTSQLHLKLEYLQNYNGAASPWAVNYAWFLSLGGKNGRRAELDQKILSEPLAYHIHY